MRRNGWSRLSLVLFVAGVSIVAISFLPRSTAQTTGFCYPGPYGVPGSGYPICPCYPGNPGPGFTVPFGFTDCRCVPYPGPAPAGFHVCPCYPGATYPAPVPPGFASCRCYPGPAPVPRGFSAPCPCWTGAPPVPFGFRDCTGAAFAAMDAFISNSKLPQGVKSSLLAKLHAAEASFAGSNRTAACNQLDALLHEVRAQSGKKLTVAQANVLAGDIQHLRTLLGCR